MNQKNYFTEYTFFHFTLILILIVSFLLTAFIRYRLLFLASPDIGGIESNIIYAVQRYLNGFPLYSNPEITPFSITQYSPFYYRIVAAIGKLINVDAINSLCIYRLSRSVSLIANTAYALLMAFLSLRFGLDKKIALTISIISFILLPPQAYSRPDSLYGLLLIATIYTNTLSIQTTKVPHRNNWLICTIVLSAFAISTKQSGIVLPIVLVSYYGFFCHQWLKALVIGISISIISLLLLVILMPEHNFTILYSNIVTGVQQGFNWPSFKFNIIDHYLRPFILQNIVGITLCFGMIQQRKVENRWLGWSVLVLFGFALLTSLKWGSALNYFTEYVALTGLVIGVWIQEQRAKLDNLGVVWPLLSVLVVLNAIVLNLPNFNWPFALQANADSKMPYYEEKKIADYLTDSLHLQPNESIFITDYNYCFLNGLLYKNCLMPQQDIVSAGMYTKKIFDYTAFNKEVQQGNIRFLITRSNETTTIFPDLNTASYILKRRFRKYDLYEIKNYQSKQSLKSLTIR